MTQDIKMNLVSSQANLLRCQIQSKNHLKMTRPATFIFVAFTCFFLHGFIAQLVGPVMNRLRWPTNNESLAQRLPAEDVAFPRKVSWENDGCKMMGASWCSKWHNLNVLASQRSVFANLGRVCLQDEMTFCSRLLEIWLRFKPSCWKWLLIYVCQRYVRIDSW